MKKLFKTFLYNFFVLFFIYLFLFSTNEVYANTYKIENIEVSNEYNTNFNKEDVIDEAFINAYHILINKITISKDHKSLKLQNLKMIKSFVESFSIVNEKFENNQYFGTFEISFNKKKLVNVNMQDKTLTDTVKLQEKNVLSLSRLIFKIFGQINIK